jgi:RHS repeat-associated protein
MTISAACATTVRFSPSRYTGKERDSESGNDYFGARYYASTMGRFMSPDVSGEPMTLPYSNIENPQSLNLYAYVNNNPLSAVDDDGHQTVPDATGCTNILCRIWHWLNTRPTNSTDDAVVGGTKGVVNSFIDAGNFLDRHLSGGHDQAPLLNMGSQAQNRGAFAAGIGMLFVPGGEELGIGNLLSRDRLLAEATNPAVRDAIKMMFREGATTGDGSTAAALEHEIETGQQVGGRWHYTKTRELRIFVQRILKGERGTISPAEKAILEGIENRLNDALRRTPTI